MRRTQPHLQERGRLHRMRGLHQQRITRTMRRARSSTFPTPSPTSRSTCSRQNTIQHLPNNEPYYQVDVQEAEEPDWGRDSESEGRAQSQDAKPEAEDNRPAVPLGHQRPAEPEGTPA